MASTTEDVVVRYRAEVDQFTKELDAIILKQDEIIKNEVKQENQEKKTVTAAQAAANKRKQLIQQEEAEIKKLRQLRALAFDPKLISQYNQKINESQKNISLLRGETAGLGSSVKNVFAGIAASLGAAFSIQQVVAFGKASIDAFLEAETSANRLKFAITSIAGGTEQAFERLVRQARRLQDVTTFNDEAIQRSQTLLANFALSAEQIETIIPLIADFAAATGQSIEEATNAVGTGLQGMGRELKKFNIEVTSNQTELENYNSIVKGFAQFQGAAAKETETLTGKLKQQENAVDELQESIGENLAPSWVKAKQALFSFIDALLRYGKINAITQKDVIQQSELAAQSVIANLEKQGQSQENISSLLRRLIADIDAEADAQERNLKARTKFGQVNRLEAEAIQNQIAGKRAVIQTYEDEIARIDERLKQQARVLKSEDLQNKSIAELNQLLKENGKLTDITSQSNVELINKELEARKKLKTEHGEDIKEMQRLDSTYGQLNERQKQLVDLAVLGATSLEDFRLKVRNLREEMEKEVKIPDTLSQDPTRPTDTPLAQPEFEDSNRLQTFLDENEQIISSTQELFNELASLASTYTDQRIEQINRTRDAELASLDQQQAAIDKQLEKRRISETQAEFQTEKLQQQRLAAEKKAADESRRLKRKAATLEKAAAIINITISTAEAVAKALTAGPYIGAVLAAIYGALGAAQIALVASQPIPYKKGTKHARGGLSLVDEEGSEAILRVKKGRLTNLDKGDKVLTAKQTRQYADLIDAMYDNRLDQYLSPPTAPILVKAQQQKENTTRQSFAKNIAQSIVLNSDWLKVAQAVERTNAKGSRMTNVDELADAISKRISPDIYRR